MLVAGLAPAGGSLSAKPPRHKAAPSQHLQTSTAQSPAARGPTPAGCYKKQPSKSLHVARVYSDTSSSSPSQQTQLAYNARGSQNPIVGFQEPSILESFDEGSDGSSNFNRNSTSSYECLHERHKFVQRYFPTALAIDDFIARAEVALCGFGFTGDNSIAMTNLCRDESTALVRDKVEAVFGSSFNVNGLGGVLTCGVSGIKAGLSHSPLATEDGRERYVFFSFPHIAIAANGELGSIRRPGRHEKSCACGALNKALLDLRQEGLAKGSKVPGVHDPLDPEFSILKQRLARRLRYERLEPSALDLADMTKVAERTITDDLEYLIEKAVDVKTADYAVITGVQIHNWAPNHSAHLPSLEFVAPTKVYVCVDGVKTHLDLHQVPALAPRQLQLLSMMHGRSHGGSYGLLAMEVGITPDGAVLQEVPADVLNSRMGGSAHLKPRRYRSSSRSAGDTHRVGWRSSIVTQHPAQARDPKAPTMESREEPEGVHPSFGSKGGAGRVW